MHRIRLHVLAVTLALISGVLDANAVRARAGGQATPSLQFDVASVKPNTLGEQPSNNWRQSPGRTDFHNSQVGELIKSAWGDFSLRVQNWPAWVAADRYDVVVQYPVDTPGPTVSLMLRALLTDRFKLAAHLETRQVPIYSLMLARPDRRLGPKLEPGLLACAPTGRANLPPECGGSGRGLIKFAYRDMPFFARMLSSMPAVGRPVVDHTGLDGNFKVEVRFNPAAQTLSTTPPGSGAPPPPPIDSDAPSIFTALQEQLGLKLEDSKGPIQVLVIDHIERPTPD